MPESADQPPPHVKSAQAARARAEYAAIESLLLGSLRGRWFLSEHARRNRAADTGMLLQAITQLEMAVLRPSRREQQLVSHLIAMRQAIADMRLEMAGSAPQGGPHAGCDIDNAVDATKAAKAEMLEAAEEIQDAAWTLRERGTGQDVYETLDRSAAGIYRACAAQDLTGKRLEAMAKALRIIEQRLGALINAWSVADVAVRGVSPAAVSGKGTGETPLLSAPEQASTALERPAWAVRDFSADVGRKDPPGIAGLDAVKRQALFG
jgi:hypothetical protein